MANSNPKLDMEGVRHLLTLLHERNIWGKGLSELDFTTALKNKYDSASTSAEQVAGINTRLQALEQLVTEDPGATDKVIDKFNEIVNFLNGIDNTQTLAPIVRDVVSTKATVDSLPSYFITGFSSRKDDGFNEGGPSFSPDPSYPGQGYFIYFKEVAYSSTGEYNITNTRKINIPEAEFGPTIDQSYPGLLSAEAASFLYEFTKWGSRRGGGNVTNVSFNIQNDSISFVVDRLDMRISYGTDSEFKIDDPVVIPLATPTSVGLMSKDDKSKLDAVPSNLVTDESLNTYMSSEQALATTEKQGLITPQEKTEISKVDKIVHNITTGEITDKPKDIYGAMGMYMSEQVANNLGIQLANGVLNPTNPPSGWTEEDIQKYGEFLERVYSNGLTIGEVLSGYLYSTYNFPSLNPISFDTSPSMDKIQLNRLGYEICTSILNEGEDDHGHPRDMPVYIFDDNSDGHDMINLPAILHRGGPIYAFVGKEVRVYDIVTNKEDPNYGKVTHTSSFNFDDVKNNLTQLADNLNTTNESITNLTNSTNESIASLANTTNESIANLANTTNESIANLTETKANLTDLDTKANISDLSNVLAEEVIDEPLLSEINTLTREEIKKDLFDDLWLTAWKQSADPTNGGIDNAATDGRKYLANGLRLTYEEAVDVYAAYKNVLRGNDYSYNRYIRTNIPPKNIYGDPYSAPSSAFMAASSIEIANVCITAMGSNMFEGSRKLHTILGTIYIRKNGGGFWACYELQNVKLREIATNYSVEHCSKLSLESVQYMITNAANTTAITITVHADIYAKLTGDTTNQAAAALTPEEATQWQQLVTDAAAKQITFVTV